MNIHAVIPFRPVNPKTRLSCVMNQEEREEFARVMLDDVVGVINESGCDTILLSTHPYEVEGATTILKESGLNEALNEFFSEISGPLLIIMSDLPLVVPESVRRIISTEKDCAIVPGRGGGTNAIFIKDPVKFHVDFYGASFLDHMKIVKDYGLSVEVIDSFRLSTDIDEKEDLVELIIHGKGKSRNYLKNLGISLSLEKGRVCIHRSPHK